MYYINLTFVGCTVAFLVIKDFHAPYIFTYGLYWLALLVSENRLSPFGSQIRMRLLDINTRFKEIGQGGCIKLYSKEAPSWHCARRGDHHRPLQYQTALEIIADG
ncbi:hypothetical protein EVAR_53378_1 [Eumeta japonica]|uniref:Uncharacterized protein n=1 Tax=Eumeta variegata TaxID=151549 RepID=A0A4C1Y5A6_EUMVA|nr:hypothetical protein EVAR_53378_1 [Eumeta japonica]